VGSVPHARESSHAGAGAITELVVCALLRAGTQEKESWNPSYLHDITDQALTLVNDALRSRTPEGHPPGHAATLALLVHAGDNAVVAHAGDSPVFRVRRNTLTKLTKEHTRVNALLDAGLITPRQAACHPDRNVLTNALGLQNFQPDIKIITTQPGDLFILASDGVTHPLGEENLSRIIISNLGKSPSQADLGKCAQAIVGEALWAGTTDNASVALGLVVPPASAVTSVYDAPTAAWLPTDALAASDRKGDHGK